MRYNFTIEFEWFFIVYWKNVKSVAYLLSAFSAVLTIHLKQTNNLEWRFYGKNISKGFVFLNIGIIYFAIFGVAQANTVTVTPFPTGGVYNGDTSWQNIQFAGVSYSWNDADGDNKVAVGDQVTFSITVEKSNWGTHDFDALKFWVDHEAINSPNPVVSTDLNTDPLADSMFMWDYNAGVSDSTDERYSSTSWDGGTKTFTFDHVFTTEGEHDFTASVTCSRDLAGITGDYGLFSSDKPGMDQWNAWREDLNYNNPLSFDYTFQGQTKMYSMDVAPVPLPGSLSLFVIGLLGLIGMSYLRKRSFDGMGSSTAAMCAAG